MRRSHANRIPPTRQQLSFEPLEPRELLAADAGYDWWSVADTPVDDWSWTFEDSSSFDAGDGAWWDDSWWAGDFSWDVPASDGTDFGDVDVAGNDGIGDDAGGHDWSADVGGADAGWSGDAIVDVIAPPAPTDAVGATDEPVATVVDVVSPPSSWPVPEEVVGTPEAESQIDPSVPVGDPAVPPAVGDPDAQSAGEPPVVSPPLIVVGRDGHPIEVSEVVFVFDVAPAAGETAADVPPDAGAPTEEPAPVDATDDMMDGSWMIDWTPEGGLPSQPVDDAGAADEDVVDVMADDAALPPTIVIVTPKADRSSLPVAVPAVAVQPAAIGFAAGRFAGLGSLFFQAFGRPAGDTDGSLAGGQGNGQSGTGRLRIRLPFRPIV